MLKDQDRIFTNLYGMHDRSLAGAKKRGHWSDTAKFIQNGRDWIVGEVKKSGLRGRGGAGFSMGKKAGFLPRGQMHKYLCCNADESEPGTFKDRVLMEHDPFAIIEAMTVAAVATGAEQGWIYVRGEYPLATERLRAATDQARAAGRLGPDALGPGRGFDIELRRGAPITTRSCSSASL